MIFVHLDDGCSVRGFVCYTARHYIVFLFDWMSMNWILFDDANIEELSDWGAVLELCLARSMLPSLLLYERAEDLRSQPRSNTIHVGDSFVSASSSGLDGLGDSLDQYRSLRREGRSHDVPTRSEGRSHDDFPIGNDVDVYMKRVSQ